jgi:hypothetical protein
MPLALFAGASRSPYFLYERKVTMELQGIQASMATSSAMRTQSRTLTDEQKSKLEEILAKYDRKI